MPAASVRIGSAHVTVSADTVAYRRGMQGLIAANQRAITSFDATGRQLQRNAVFFSQFAQSIRGSLIATAAYAAGIGTVSAGLRGVTTNFLDFDQGLIRISKTTGLAGQEIADLGERLIDINTRAEGTARAIDISRESILDIAVAAGQAGLADVRSIDTLARAVAALESSSNLVGEQAVRALIRYQNVTGQNIDVTDAFASALTNLGNNTVATEAELARFATRIGQNIAGIAQSTNQLNLGLGASLIEAGVELEVAGSSLQRTFAQLQASVPDTAFFDQLATRSGEAAESFEQLRQRMVAGTATAEDYDRVFLAFLRTIRSLPEVGTDETPSRRSFINSVIGGGEANVRNVRVLATLVSNYDNLERNIELANEGLVDQTFHFQEAAAASEAYRARLQVVGRQLAELGVDVGQQIVPALVSLAENWERVGTALLGTGAGLLGQRGIGAITAQAQTLREETRLANAGLAIQRDRVSEAQRRLTDYNASRIHYIESLRREGLLQTRLSDVTAQANVQRERQARQESRLAVVQSRRDSPQQARRQQQVTTQLRRETTRLNRLNAEAVNVEEQLKRATQRRSDALEAYSGVQARAGNDQRRINVAIQREERLTNELNQQKERLNQQTAIATRNNNALARTGRAVASGLAAIGRTIVPIAIGIGVFEGLFFILRRLRGAADEAAENFERLSTDVDNFIQQSSSGAQTQAGALLSALNNEIERLNGEIAELETRRESAGGFAARSQQTSIDSSIEDRIRQQELLREQIRRVEEAQESSGERAVEASRRTTASFREVARSTLDAVFAAEQFELQQSRTLEDARAEARLRQRTASFSPLQTGIAERVQEQQLQRDRALQDAQIEQFRNERRIEDAQRRVNEAIRIRDRLETNSEARRLADRSVERLENELQGYRDITGQLDLQARLLRNIAESGPDIDEIEETARLERQAAIAAARNQQITAPPVEAGEQVRRAEEAVRAENERLDSIRRNVRQEIELRRQATDQDEAGLRARFEVQNRYSDLVVEALRREAAERAILAQASEDLAAVQAEIVTASDADVDSLVRREVSLRNLIAAQQSSVAESQAYSAALADQSGAIEAAAASAQFLAAQTERNPLQSLVADAERLTTALQDVAARGFNSLTDTLVELVRTGRASFSDLANSIIADLLRVLIRAQVVLPLIQSLSGIFPGFFGGGFGAPAFAFGPSFHSGGIAPYAPQRQRSPGLRSDEILARLQKGEIVLPRWLSRQVQAGDYRMLEAWIRRLPKFHEGGVAGRGSSGSGGSGGGTIRVNWENRGRREQEVVTATAQQSGRDTVINIISDDIRHGGRVVGALRSRNITI